jgi:hypothetical protein
MLYAVLPLIPQEIKPEAILGRLRLGYEGSSECDPLRRIYQAFEDGVLYPLATIFTKARDAAQSLPPRVVSGAHIIADKNQHARHLQKKAG